MYKFGFINENLPADSYNELVRVVSRRLTDRGCSIGNGKADLTLCFSVDKSFGRDGFTVEAIEKNTVRITADCVCNVFAGVGRFLTLSSFAKGFKPATLPINHTMKKPVRGMYFATHFFNFYHIAPVKEVESIIADLALRGYNYLCLLIAGHHYTSYKDDPEAVKDIARTKELFAYASLCGMNPALITLSNTCHYNYPKELAAVHTVDENGHYFRGLHAVNTDDVCPSKPEGLAEIEREHRELFKALKGCPVKMFILWEYDEGGCLCDDCYPWTTNGFMKVVDVDRRLLKETGFGDAQIVLSTWHFGVSMKDEWENFYPHLAAGEYDFASYIMTSFRTGRIAPAFEKNGIPANVHLIDFPEISMCGIQTWGGYGTNPITMFLDNVEYLSGYCHEGGFPYSEGIYEDINKWVCAGFYTGYYNHSEDAVRDYIRYEFGTEDTEELLRAIKLMESSLPRTIDKRLDESGNQTGEPWIFQIRWGTAIPEIHRIVMEADKKLPENVRKCWKWRIVVIRAEIDYQLYLNEYKLRDNPTAQALFHELKETFHLDKAYYYVSVPEGK